MPIPASQIVQVNPRIIAAGANNLEFNGLLPSKNSNIPAGTVLQFTESGGVSDYFGAESEEAKLAAVYFLGYDNSFIKPRKLFIARFIDEDIAAFIRGAKVPAAIDELKLITAGTLTLTLTEEISLSGLDFSGAATYSDIAQTLQTAIRAASEETSATNAVV